MIWDDPYNGYSRRRQGDWYDTKQVCLNGHQITDFAQSDPSAQRSFCEQCGAATIMACPSCGTPIRGHHHLDGVVALGFQSSPPRHCPDCGQPLPWQQAALDNFTEVLRDAGVSEADMEVVLSCLPDLTRNTPRTDSAALKLRRVLKKVDQSLVQIVLRAAKPVLGAAARATVGVTEDTIPRKDGGRKR